LSVHSSHLKKNYRNEIWKNNFFRFDSTFCKSCSSSQLCWSSKQTESGTIRTGRSGETRDCWFVLKLFAWSQKNISTSSTWKSFETWCQFHQCFSHSFYARRSQQGKKNTVKSSVSFYTFGVLQLQKLFIERWWNWAQVSISSTFYE